MPTAPRLAQRTLFGYISIAMVLLVIGISALVPSSSALTNNGSINAFGTPLTENFNTLATTGTANTWTDNVTLPGWYSQFELAPANPTVYIANAGGTNNGAIYSFGTGTSTERALGSASSGTPGTIYNAVKLTNNTGATVTSLDINFTGEQWRNGGNVNAQTLAFQYQVANAGTITDANAPTTGWTGFSTLDFISPTTGATIAALDGNAAANRTAKSATLAVTVSAGQEVWLRWMDINDAGNDHGLAIDDFSVTANGAGPTNPTGVGAANPSSVVAGGTTLLTVAVTPGTSPVSTGLAVTADLTPIGGVFNQQFYDDGTHGDATANDKVFSFSATVASGTSGGSKTLNCAVSDAQPRSSNTSISLTVLVPTPPSGVSSANPSNVQAGNATLLTVAVTPGANPTSAGLTVVGDLSLIGGSGTQPFFDNGTNGDVTSGDNTFSFSVVVSAATPSGSKTLPIQISDNYPRTANTSISLVVQDAPVPPGAIVISQVYGGGGNAGATLKNDFIEIFNRSQNPVNLANWSVQYASAGGGAAAAWNRKTTLSGTINPGQYFLIREAAGAGGTVDLPPADVVGSIAMGATDGKVALVNNDSFLPNGCPIGNANVIDFVGYGVADCFEGTAAAPVLTNATADFRSRGGCKDTDQNASNFTRSTPSPRNSSTTVNVCPASGDFSPQVESVFPTNGTTGVDNNTDIAVTFDEPVDVSTSWFQISCANSGIHTATFSGGPTAFTINPVVNFGDTEQCTVTVYKNEVSDQDLLDPPDHMDADYIFAFTTAINRDPAEHMVMGNPSGAVTDVGTPLNYLMMKPQYALSYNDDKGTTNWTSWHLDSTWTTGVSDRQNDFRSDDTLPPSFKHVSNGYNFATYSFDRGHMCPSADRTSSIGDNSATFLMTNMVPQASGNNQGPWAAMEGYIRLQLNGSTNELYILSGGNGTGGNSATGHWDSILDTAGNTVNVPHVTWKVVMVLPNAVGDDVARVDGSTRTFAVIMPNDDNIRSDQWQKYLATVDQVEALTGYDFYSNVPATIQGMFEAKLDTVNDTAPVTSNQSSTTAEDQSVAVTLSATDFNVNNVFTYTVVTQPQHGSISGSGANLTYSPDSHYFGPDSFTFTANDGALDSNVSTVNITVTEVNNDPVAVNDDKETAEDSSLSFAASDLTSNDSPGPNESGQTLAVDSVISTGNTHGGVVLSGGQITYTPALNYNGPASFDYHFCDNGTTNGVSDPKCATGTVNLTVTPVNDSPVAVDDSATTDEDTPVTIDVVTNDTDVDGDARSLATVGNAVNGSVAILNGMAVFSPNPNFHGTGSFTYTVSDGNGGQDTGDVTVTVNSVNDNPVAVDDSATTDEDTAVTIDVVANDTDVDGDARSLATVGNAVNGSVAILNGMAVFSPNPNFHGTGSFTYTVSDGNGGEDTGDVTVAVNSVNDNPVAVDDSATTDEDTPVTIDVVTNDTDVDGDARSLATVGNAVNGSVAILNGMAVFSPNPNFHGTGSFTYTVSDGNGGQDTGDVTVTVNSVNDNPVAVDDSATTDEDTAVAIDVVANDTDVDGDARSLATVGNAVNGSVAILNGMAVFSPNPNFHGTGSFTYTVSDGNGGEDTGDVTINVNSVNDAPDANNDATTISENSGANTIDVLFNDADVDGDALSVFAVTQGAHGSVANNVSSISYTPNAGFFGSDSFTYTVSDGNGGTDTATVNVTVATEIVTGAVTPGGTVSTGSEPTADDPTETSVTSPVAGTITIAETTTSEAPADATTYNFLDVQVNITAPAATAADPLRLVFLLDSSVIPAGQNFNTLGVFRNGVLVEACSAAALAASPQAAIPSPCVAGRELEGDNIKLTVLTALASSWNFGLKKPELNNAPVAVTDSYTVDEDHALTVAVPSVLGNDTDPDGNTLTATLVTNSTHGTLVLNANGSFTYTPNANFNGQDGFSYKANDGTDYSNQASVTISVGAVNDAPTANGQSVSTNANTPLSITLTGSDIESPSGLTFAVTSGPAHGSLSGAGANRTYTPAANYSGPDSFKFTVTDTGDGSSPALTSPTATVSITVNDTVAPTITLNGNSISLWPPNKTYRAINVTDLVASASDNFDPTVNRSKVVISRVTSDEPEKGPCTGNSGANCNGNSDDETLNDIVIGANCKSVQLRAERNGNGNGRVYTITFKVTDAAGNATTATAKVNVPHNQGGVAVDSGLGYAVNGTCP